MELHDRIYVAGHRGLVGSAIVRALGARGFDNLVLKTRRECDLTDWLQVSEMFELQRPDHVFLAAARVGGIAANEASPADFIRDNLDIQQNVIKAAREFEVKKLLFLGSSCIYPKHAPQPMREEHLLSGPLEPTNQWYAIAKIAGIMMCQAYRRQYGMDCICLMPTNLYGPGDNFDLETSHVLPALIRKFCEARDRGLETVSVWGTGTPRREFMHVDDLAEACLFLMDRYSGEEIVNVGVGRDVTIAELAGMVARATGFAGAIEFDTARPDGTPQKLLDVSKLEGLGFKAGIPLEEGIARTVRWYEENRAGGE